MGTQHHSTLWVGSASACLQPAGAKSDAEPAYQGHHCSKSTVGWIWEEGPGVTKETKTTSKDPVARENGGTIHKSTCNDMELLDGT